MAATDGTSPRTRPELGPLVRLHPIAASKLPAHPDLTPYQTSTDQLPDLSSFVSSVLAEAATFVTGYVPTAFEIKSASKKSPPSHATIQLLEHHLPASALPVEVRPQGGPVIAENWFARSSLHEDRQEAGTGTWEEFEGALLDNHSQHEMDYTPDVFDAHRVLTWDDELSKLEGKVESWEKVGMSIYEMAHKIPPPLTNRVFPVVIITAKNTSKSPHSFIVVQIPVDISNVPSALYANGRHKTEGDTAQKKKDVTMGVYVSVERCEHEENGHVKWMMATASDAKGVLPMWMQKMGVPAAVVKDVGLLVDWLDKRRKAKA